MNERIQATLTDEQVVRVLAEREGKGRHLHYVIGPTPEDYKCGYCGRVFFGRLNEVCPKSPKPLYLESRDALQPVLEGLSEEEWSGLYHRHLVVIQFPVIASEPLAFGRHTAGYTRLLLTLPARDLACAIAGVLVQQEVHS